MATSMKPMETDEPYEDERTALTKEAFKRAFLDNLFYVQGKFPALATQNDYYQALACAVRDRLLQRWISTAAAYTKQGSRTVAYFSAEFLMGPHLGNNLINLGIYAQVREAITELGLDFDTLLRQEDEPGLGNGGLGRWLRVSSTRWRRWRFRRWAMASATSSAFSIKEIVDGWQMERTDKWLRFGNPWEILRPEWGGRGEARRSHRTISRRARSVCACAGCRTKVVVGVPYDTPILGYRNNTANTLRLWKAEAPESFDFSDFQPRRLWWRGPAESVVGER